MRLWDAATGRPIAEMRGHKNTIRWVAFGPDGRRIVSASSDQTAWLWDGVNGRPIAPLRGHTESLWQAIFSPDGNRVVTASADQTMRLWDASSGDLIAVLRGHKAEVWARRSPRTAHSWCRARPTASRASGTWSWRSGTGSSAGTRASSTTSPSAPTASGRPPPPGTARCGSGMRPPAGKPPCCDMTTAIRTRHIVVSVAWHPGGGQLATVTRGDTITLWDLATGKPSRVFTAPTGYWAGDARAVFNPAGTLLASGSRDGSVRLWDVATGKPAGVLRGHAGAALDMAFSPDGSRLASVGFDGTVRLWDAATRSAVGVLSGDPEGYRIAYSADGRLIAACSLRGNVRLWDAHTYHELAELAAREPGARPGVQSGGHPPGDGLRRQHHPPVGPRQPAGGLRAAWARGLRPCHRLQPGRHPAGFGFRRLHGANLGHGPTVGAGEAAGGFPTIGRPYIRPRPKAPYSSARDGLGPSFRCGEARSPDRVRVPEAGFRDTQSVGPGGPPHATSSALVERDADAGAAKDAAGVLIRATDPEGRRSDLAENRGHEAARLSQSHAFDNVQDRALFPGSERQPWEPSRVRN